MTKVLKDPASALTHFAGCIAAMIAAVPLLIRASMQENRIYTFALGIFILSMIMLYGASTLYHSINSTEKVNKRFKKLDHMMIFVLIAGTYTPVCLIVLEPPMGYFLCALVWGIALVGILLKAFWVTCPKWFSSILYIGMGWVCLIAFRQIHAGLPTAAFNWLLCGGLLYTIGGVIYALKLPKFNAAHPNFGTHEIFHVFCLGGSFCHFMLMFQYVVRMPLA
ncbi:MAG: hemolysin III family protein [Lachnospiraceae bacterium]|nr:hemolysin III family protein [Lachnospiraceae bacterium]